MCSTTLHRYYYCMCSSVQYLSARPKKYWLMQIAVFFVIGLEFVVEGAMHPISLISDGVGILIGIILAYYEIKSSYKGTKR